MKKLCPGQSTMANFATCNVFILLQLSRPASTVGTALWSSLPNRNSPKSALWKHHNVRRFCPKENPSGCVPESFFSPAQHILVVLEWVLIYHPSYHWKMYFLSFSPSLESHGKPRLRFQSSTAPQLPGYPPSFAARRAAARFRLTQYPYA